VGRHGGVAAAADLVGGGCGGVGKNGKKRFGEGE
jgi:hypothetical protein